MDFDELGNFINKFETFIDKLQHPKYRGSNNNWYDNLST